MMNYWLERSYQSAGYEAQKRRKLSGLNKNARKEADDWLNNVVDRLTHDGAVAFDREELQRKLSDLLRESGKKDISVSLQSDLLDLLGPENLSFIGEVLSVSEMLASSSTAPGEKLPRESRALHVNTSDSYPAFGTQLRQAPDRLHANSSPSPNESEDGCREIRDSPDIPTQTYCKHSSYPFPILNMSFNIQPEVCNSGSRAYKDRPDLDMQFFRFLSHKISIYLFQHLRQYLPFYRVKYEAHQREIMTPRFTTVFGLDTTSNFSEDGKIVDSKNPSLSVSSRYSCTPRPIPQCLQLVKEAVEELIGDRFTHVLVNYYSGGQDSISYHSDDEKFLGPLPCIASLSLGSRRDFLLKHKEPEKDADVLKLSLESGDMLVMRGTTQSRWLHSIPKRKSAGDRINITFRKAVMPAGTENYVRYNIGSGPVYRRVGDNMVCQDS